MNIKKRLGLEKKRPPGPPRDVDALHESKRAAKEKPPPSGPPPDWAVRDLSRVKQSDKPLPKNEPALSITSTVQAEQEGQETAEDVTETRLSKDTQKGPEKRGKETSSRAKKRRINGTKKKQPKLSVSQPKIVGRSEPTEKQEQARPSGRRPPSGAPPPAGVSENVLAGIAAQNGQRGGERSSDATEKAAAADRGNVGDEVQTNVSVPNEVEPAAVEAPKAIAPPDARPGSADDEDLRKKLLSALNPGRLVIRCIRASNIRRKDQTTSVTKLNPYLSFSVGAESSENAFIHKKSKVQLQTGIDPFFRNEVLAFNLLRPNDFVQNDDIQIKIELRDSTESGSELLGEVTLSLLRFLIPHAKSEEWIPLVQSSDTSSNSRLQLELGFEVVKTGLAVIKLLSFQNLALPFPQIETRLHAKVRRGNDKDARRSRTVSGEDQFRGEEMLFWVDSTKPDCFDELFVEIFQESEADTDTTVGKQNVCPLTYMTAPKGQPDAAHLTLDLLQEGGVKAGSISVEFQFLEAGYLRAQILGGRYLRDIRPSGNMDPYVSIKAKGKASTLIQKTCVDSNGDTNPQFDETLTLPIVDHHKVIIECFDHDPFKDDHDLIGRCQVSLLPVFKSGRLETWAQLQYTNEFGVLMDCGQVHCKFTFNGPRGVAFPRHQPSMAVFDDQERFRGDANVAKGSKERSSETKKVEREVLGQEVIQQYEEDADCGFTEEGIRKGFGRIDLDKNGYVGASELKHMLICMGELVTDEEIDMMISMLDFNGDGQVGLDAFRLMVKDPDPARDEFGPDREPPPAAVDAEVLQRRKQIETRNAKRRVFSAFVSSNRIRKEDLLRAWEDIRTKQEGERSAAWREPLSPNGGRRYTPSWTLDFGAFCDLLPVVVTAETERAFELLDPEGSGKADAREMLLSFSNFLQEKTMTVEERCRLMFDLFDEDRSGFLSLTEVEGMMIGSHMKCRSAVARKARTVMKVADTDRSGGITLNELTVAAAKFPNLLLPNHGESGVVGAKE